MDSPPLSRKNSSCKFLYKIVLKNYLLCYVNTDCKFETIEQKKKKRYIIIINE